MNKAFTIILAILAGIGTAGTIVMNERLTHSVDELNKKLDTDSEE